MNERILAARGMSEESDRPEERAIAIRNEPVFSLGDLADIISELDGYEDALERRGSQSADEVCFTLEDMYKEATTHGYSRELVNPILRRKFGVKLPLGSEVNWTELMTQDRITMADFNRYFKSDKLGKLHLPNGKCFIPNGPAFEQGTIVKFNVELRDLYKLITEWKISGNSVPMEDILGVIAFGSAVKYPGYEQKVNDRKKYLLWGPKIRSVRRIPIQPNDADFLVVTGSNMIKEDFLRPFSIDTYDCGTWIERGGIHLINRGVEQVINGMKTEDTVSISALSEGVPIIVSDNSFYEIWAKTGASHDTPRKVSWGEDMRRNLVGVIN